MPLKLSSGMRSAKHGIQVAEAGGAYEFSGHSMGVTAPSGHMEPAGQNPEHILDKLQAEMKGSQKMML